MYGDDSSSQTTQPTTHTHESGRGTIREVDCDCQPLLACFSILELFIYAPIAYDDRDIRV